MDLMLAFAFFIAVMVSAIVFDFSMIIALLAGLVAFIIVGNGGLCFLFFPESNQSCGF